MRRGANDGRRGWGLKALWILVQQTKLVVTLALSK